MKCRKADVVIIGSGVGGLCTAARLAHHGMNVVVIERLPFIGGRFSTRVVKGFKIPTGAIIVPFGKRSVFQEVFDLFGLELKVRTPKGETVYRLPHGDYEVPPRSGGLAGMLQFALQDRKEAEKLFCQFRRALSWWEPSDQMSFKDWLYQYTHNDNVQRMFQGFCAAFIGTNSYEVPAGEFFRFLKTLGRNVNYGIAQNGNMKLMENLADALIEKNCHIELETSCKDIVSENGMVKGIRLENAGKEEMIEADFVISNAGPLKTVALAGEQSFEKSYLSLIWERNFTVPVVYLAISSPESLYDHPGVLNFGNTRRLVFLETPTLTCPELAPEGKHLTITFGVPKFSTGPLKLRDTINMVLLDLQDNFPSFEREAEVIHTGTHHGDWPTMHRWLGYQLPTRTSIENLYLAGDGSMPPGLTGIEGCARSAKNITEDIFTKA
jgi:phytoene dehydrogenase-like protein